MKVIVAGLPKTGTKSMHWALQTLGYSIYDFPENAFLLSDDYSKIMNEGWTSDDFRRMYENVDAAMDDPVCFFWEEIGRAFPNAKIVLTIRDGDETWFRSFEQQIAGIDSSVLFRFMEVFSLTYIKYRTWRNKLGVPSQHTVSRVWNERFLYENNHRQNAKHDRLCTPTKDGKLAETNPFSRGCTDLTTPTSNIAHPVTGCWCTNAQRVGNLFANFSVLPFLMNLFRTKRKERASPTTLQKIFHYIGKLEMKVLSVLSCW